MRVIKTYPVCVRVCARACRPSHLEPTTDPVEDQRAIASPVFKLFVTMINERSVTIRAASWPLAPAQNFNPSGSGCSRLRNHSRVRGLEPIGTRSNACWIEEERDAVQVAAQSEETR